MSTSASETAATYDDVRPDVLARLTGVPRAVAVDSVGSTLDLAHELAEEGAEGGTLVLADSQTAGRGRGGNRWASEAGGIWLTLLERGVAADVIDLLALRLGLAAAMALDAFAENPVRVKWPNDLYVSGRKLAGILVEARWRDGAPEWVAIGMGINVRPSPAVPNACGLRVGVSRVDVLAALVPALRTALGRHGQLDAEELAELARRDMAAGREIDSPGIGRVEGVAASGELIVRRPDGAIDHYRAGSLVFREES